MTSKYEAQQRMALKELGLQALSMPHSQNVNSQECPHHA